MEIIAHCNMEMFLTMMVKERMDQRKPCSSNHKGQKRE